MKAEYRTSPRGSNSDDPITVLVVDDEDLVRGGIRYTLHGVAQIVVVGDAPSAAEAIHECKRLAPEVVLMEIRLSFDSADDGIAATRTITALTPQPAVIMLTIKEDERSLYDSMEAGASGYLLKQETRSRDDLVDAILAVVEGRLHIAPKMQRFFFRQARRLRGPGTFMEDRPILTSREVEVLYRTAAGWTTNEIANDLGLVIAAIDAHWTLIYAKLNATNRAHAVWQGVKLGILTDEGMAALRPSGRSLE